MSIERTSKDTQVLRPYQSIYDLSHSDVTQLGQEILHKTPKSERTLTRVQRWALREQYRIGQRTHGGRMAIDPKQAPNRYEINNGKVEKVIK